MFNAPGPCCGLSPRVRGSLYGAQRQHERLRSIPASAGQPLKARGGGAPAKVYPRECGAANSGCFLVHQFDGSIPASAGQPRQVLLPVLVAAVYPRECGAAVIEGGFQGHIDGLSPRVRGSRDRLRSGKTRSRSIPASAGQPMPISTVGPLFPVYPRECGAASS